MGRKKKYPSATRGKKKPFSSPDPNNRDFTAVAGLIAPEAPKWLAEHLERYASSIALDRAVEHVQPTRAEMRDILIKTREAAALLLRAVQEISVREFLNKDMAHPVNLSAAQALLTDLRMRADRASRSPQLVNQRGKTKAGRGGATPEETHLSAQSYCALVIVETWKFVKGRYPTATDNQAAEAIDLYWQLAGGQTQSWGSKKLTLWRYHIRQAIAWKSDKERAEILRQVTLSKAFAS